MSQQILNSFSSLEHYGNVEREWSTYWDWNEGQKDTEFLLQYDYDLSENEKFLWSSIILQQLLLKGNKNIHSNFLISKNFRGISQGENSTGNGILIEREKEKKNSLSYLLGKMFYLW